MIKLFELSQTFTSITIRIEISSTLKLEKRTKMVLTVLKQNQPGEFEKKQTHEFNIPFPTEYLIRNCDSQTNYKLNLRLENGQSNYVFSLFASTLCDPYTLPIQQAKQKKPIMPQSTISQNKQITISENNLLDLISIQDSDVKYFDNKQQIQQTILKARKNQSSQAFINQDYKISRPPSLRKERFRRVWMISKGHELYDNLYGNLKQGQEFMKNDWFMGPFYSYDKNAKDLEKEQQQLNVSEN